MGSIGLIFSSIFILTFLVICLTKITQQTVNRWRQMEKSGLRVSDIAKRSLEEYSLVWYHLRKKSKILIEGESANPITITPFSNKED